MKIAVLLASCRFRFGLNSVLIVSFDFIAYCFGQITQHDFILSEPHLVAGLSFGWSAMMQSVLECHFSTSPIFLLMEKPEQHNSPINGDARRTRSEDTARRNVHSKDFKLPQAFRLAFRHFSTRFYSMRCDEILWHFHCS